MKTETTKEQTRRLIQLGCPAPPEIENWLLDILTQDHLTYYDEDSCIHVLRNYTLGEVYTRFLSMCRHKSYNIDYVGKKWMLKIDGIEDVLENEEHIDLLVDGIEKLMEGH